MSRSSVISSMGGAGGLNPSETGGAPTDKDECYTEDEEPVR